jgi:hypothetical protein
VSVKVMSQVWELDLPATDKLILLGFADHANDEGICRPSFARVAWKCGISKETVKRTVRRFREPGILAKIAEAGGPGCPAVWQISPQRGSTMTPFVSDLERANGGHGPGEWGSRVPGMGVTAMTSESNTGIEDLEPTPRAQNLSAANPSAKEAQNRRNIGARNAREAREQTAKTEAHVGGISMGRMASCNMCGIGFSSEEFAEHVCPVEQKLGIDTRRRQRADAGARAKGAAA